MRKFVPILALGIFVCSSSTAFASGTITLYEGNGCTQDVVGTIQARAGNEINCTSSNVCKNDEARSMRVNGVARRTKIRVCDNSSCDTDDDISDIVVRSNESFCVGTFEESIVQNSYRIDRTVNDGNLDGKVSRIEIR